jgi:hypothetical protein
VDKKRNVVSFDVKLCLKDIRNGGDYGGTGVEEGILKVQGKSIVEWDENLS